MLSGCATSHTASIAYEPTQDFGVIPHIDHAVAMGTFTDNRGTHSRWLGAVLNALEMPVKKLYTEQSVDYVIKTAFSEALKNRGINVTRDGAKVVIEASIMKFDCYARLNYEAQAHIHVRIVSFPSKTTIYSKTFKTYNKLNGFGGGLYGGYKNMGPLAQNTLNQTIDKFFADPFFISALANQPTIGVSDGLSIGDRLRTLEKLKQDGVISESEYKSKRRALLDSL